LAFLVNLATVLATFSQKYGIFSKLLVTLLLNNEANFSWKNVDYRCQGYFSSYSSIMLLHAKLDRSWHFYPA
jgi:hypothetical protein